MTPMVRWVFGYGAGAPLMLVALCAPAADDPAVKIAAAERRLPWLWSPSVEGMADIPYTYESRMTRRLRTRGGKEIPATPGADGLVNWRSLQLERIPLDFGAQLRCISQDGSSPCSSEWIRELERQHKSRDSLTAEDRVRINRTRQERRQRRWDFWDRFPDAFRFEMAAANQLKFSPRPGFKAESTALTAIAGR